jgi:hypothetical protein
MVTLKPPKNLYKTNLNPKTSLIKKFRVFTRILMERMFKNNAKKEFKGSTNNWKPRQPQH